jgi:hypothetical protein
VWLFIATVWQAFRRALRSILCWLVGHREPVHVGTQTGELTSHPVTDENGSPEYAGYIVREYYHCNYCGREFWQQDLRFF